MTRPDHARADSLSARDWPAHRYRQAAEVRDVDNVFIAEDEWSQSD